MKFTAAFAWLGCSLLTSACSGVDPAQVRNELMDADRAFAEATLTRGAHGWASYFAEDAVMIIPGREVRGPSEILSVIEPSFRDSTFAMTWEPRRAQVSSLGDLGYTVGQYETTEPTPMGVRLRSAVRT